MSSPSNKTVIHANRIYGSTADFKIVEEAYSAGWGDGSGKPLSPQAPMMKKKNDYEQDSAPN